MPDVDDAYARRGRLLPVLFWAGVGLAPLAGLLVLLGNGASLRVGAFLAVVALLLIGLSVALRPDPNAIRLQLEEMLLEELDRLRAEVREDIAGASRATHQTIGERLGAMQQVIDSLRGERARYAAPHSAPPPAVHHPAARAVPAAAQHTAQQAAAPPLGRYRPMASHPVPPYPVQPHSGPPVTAAAQRSAPPGAPAGRHPVPPPPVAAPVAGPGQPVGGRRAAQHQAHPPPEPVGGRATPPPPGGGVYRHTETVQVTTRSTYVDEHAPNGDGGRRYDGGYSGHDWSGAGSHARAAEPHQESWTDQKLRERYGRRPRPYDRAEDESGEQPWTRRSTPWEEPVSAAPVSSGRGAGRGSEGGRRHRHRWDQDESGELQLGQRRAAARGDGNGTELRLEERWASFRRDDNGHRRPDYRAADYRADARGPDYGRPALPSSSDEPSWNDSWDEPMRESRGHRYQPDFELSDERWR